MIMRMPVIKPDEVRAERLQAGLTTEQAAELVGCSKRSWERLEAGKTSKFSEMRLAFFKIKLEKMNRLTPHFQEGAAAAGGCVFRGEAPVFASNENHN